MMCVSGREKKIFTLRLPLVVKALWQIVHLNGLSPVCVRICICKADEDEKFLLQTWHKCFGKPANTPHAHFNSLRAVKCSLAHILYTTKSEKKILVRVI